jgi:hypothetical protein
MHQKQPPAKIAVAIAGGTGIRVGRCGAAEQLRRRQGENGEEGNSCAQCRQGFAAGDERSATPLLQ